MQKTNILFMLSNLYIIEWIFNTYGMFVFVKENSKLEIFTVSLIILYVPLFYTISFITYVFTKCNKGACLACGKL